MKIEHVLFPSVYFKITDPCVGHLFLLCSHDRIFGTNKNWILQIGLCERAYRLSGNARPQPNGEKTTREAQQMLKLTFESNFKSSRHKSSSVILLSRQISGSCTVWKRIKF